MNDDIFLCSLLSLPSLFIFCFNIHLRILYQIHVRRPLRFFSGILKSTCILGTFLPSSCGSCVLNYLDALFIQEYINTNYESLIFFFVFSMCENKESSFISIGHF